MAKSVEIIELLERRIKHGDYLINEVPAERELASEFSVSGLTARKAYQRLVEKGLLRRKSNGRLEINKDNPKKQLNIAFLVSDFSSHIHRWQVSVEKVASQFDSIVRSINFLHWDDPIIAHNISGFDGVFLLPSNESIPERVIEAFRNQCPPVVAIDFDLTEFGIPSIDLLPAVFVQNLLDHLVILGHKSIDCINAYPANDIIQARVHQWNIWRYAHNVKGQLIEGDFKNPDNMSGIEMGYAVMKNLIQDGLKSSAILCVNMPYAVGAMRACFEAKVVVGKDISICAVDGEGYAQYQTPTLTCLDNCNPAPYLSVCFEWFENLDKGWVGPLKLQPSKPNLFIGESTGRGQV